MGIVHIVLWEFKPTLHLSQVNDTCQRLLALKEKCIHPETQKPYIKSIVGGLDNSPGSNFKGAYSHAFVFDFESKEDRDYYFSVDPAHLEFVATLGDTVLHTIVVGFEPGKFEY